MMHFAIIYSLSLSLSLSRSFVRYSQQARYHTLYTSHQAGSRPWSTPMAHRWCDARSTRTRDATANTTQASKQTRDREIESFSFVPRRASHRQPIQPNRAAPTMASSARRLATTRSSTSRASVVPLLLLLLSCLALVRLSFSQHHHQPIRGSFVRSFASFAWFALISVSRRLRDWRASEATMPQPAHRPVGGRSTLQ